MNNGKIFNNTASVSSTVTTVRGGGVLMYGNFIMEDGEISNNEIVANSLSNVVEIYGGGVCVVQSSFTMKGGRITGNTASSTNSMSAGYGGGVHVSGISGYPGTFIMQGGEISGNTISANYFSRGGGVHVGTNAVNNLNFSSFIKTGGIVTGYADNSTTGNVAKNSSGTIQTNQGHAVYASDPVRRRETTAGLTDNLNTSTAGVAGGWEN